MEKLFPFLLGIPQIFSLAKKGRMFTGFETLDGLANFLLKIIPKSDHEKYISKAKSISGKCKDLGISFVHYYEDKYPALLKNIHDPPITLFYTGNTEIFSLDSVSVIGTRKASRLSLFATGLLPDFISRNRLSAIVSGMAIGIDRAITKAALDANIPIVGVLGTGPEGEYPAANRDLYRQMKKSPNALLISEMVPGSSDVRNYSFIHRNRIITGLSRLTIIMESPVKSGAMSSASHAISQHRELLVFDHENLSQNAGGRQLISDGAKKLTLEEISSFKTGVFHISEIISAEFRETPRLLSYLGKLEFQGAIKDLGGGYYFRKENLHFPLDSTL